VNQQDIHCYFARGKEIATPEFHENCSVTAQGCVGSVADLTWQRLLKRKSGRPDNSGCNEIKKKQHVYIKPL